MRLSELKENQTAVVTKINLEPSLKNQLLNMGLFVGGDITFVRKAPLNDPLEYIAAGNYLALRKKEAMCIEIEVK